MFRFLKKRSKTPQVPREVTGEALRAVPRHSPGAEAKEDPETGKLYLRLKLAARNPLAKVIERGTGWKRFRQFDLDPVGREFWELCDGRRDLGRIEKLLRDRHGWDKDECRHAVVTYTMTLTRRQLLYLDLSHRRRKVGAEERQSN